MGRPKGSSNKVKKTGDDASQWKKTPNIVSLRGSQEYKAWLDEFAESQRMTVAGLIDYSLAELARQRGFRVPPKR